MFVILYNLNLLLNAYIDIMVKLITMFNYKNTTDYKNFFFINDILLYNVYKNRYFYKFL